ncbi:hypothetical protein HS7_01920 [Sulfolobales archaeon HS-7]|nr:hypothetical protein HS7_01920 [Sulfolobales archaeon HS-7]
MNILLVGIYDSELTMRSFYPIDLNGEQSASPEEAKISLLAESNFLKSQGHNVKVVVITALDQIRLLPEIPDIKLWRNVIKGKVKEALGVEPEVIPSVGEFVWKDMRISFSGTIGNYMFALYYIIWNVMNEFSPDVVFLDTTNGFTIHTAAASRAVRLCTEDYNVIQDRGETYFIHANAGEGNEKAPSRIHVIVKRAIKDVKIPQYLNDDIKIGKEIVGNEEKIIPAKGKSDILGISWSIENGYPLPIAYIAKEANLEEYTNPSVLFGKLNSEFVSEKKDNVLTVSPSLHLNENAILYLFGYHLIDKLRREISDSPFPINNVIKLSKLMDKANRDIVEREIANIENLAQIALKNEIRGEEFSLNYLWAIGNMRVIDYIRKKEPEKEDEECVFDERNFSAHAGIVKELTKVTLKDGKIMLSYRGNCKDVVINEIKRLGRGEND